MMDDFNDNNSIILRLQSPDSVEQRARVDRSLGVAITRFTVKSQRCLAGIGQITTNQWDCPKSHIRHSATY